MFRPLIVVLAFSQVASAYGSGTVTSVVGRVHMERRGNAVSLHQGSQITAGDRLITTASGKTSFYLHDGFAVYLGSDTTVVLDGQPGAWKLKMVSGEARITAGGQNRFEVHAQESVAMVKRGILRVRAGQENVLFKSEHGNADVYLSGGRSRRISSSQEMIVSKGEWDSQTRKSGESWSVHLADFQLAQADGAQPNSPRDAPGVNNSSSQQTLDDEQQQQPAPEEEERQDEAPDFDQRGTDQTPGEGVQVSDQPLANAGSFSSLSLGGLSSGSAGAGASGATFSDANQQ
nr:hypothetical protein [Burkholderiales bacterium]